MTQENSWLGKFRHKLYSRSADRPRLYGNSAKSFQDLVDRLRADGYFSQYGQDKWVIEEILPNKKEGVFVDIGAHDGMAYSNTYILESNYNWSGLAVEPIPEVYDKLKSTRNCHTVNACVAESTGKRVFRINTGYNEMLSGLVNEYHPQHLERISEDEFREVEVSCFSFNDLLKKFEINSVDYLNIDVEGAEYSILSNIDFNLFRIKVIGVENNYGDYRIPKLLKKNGYKMHSIIGDDEFYVLKN